MFEHQGKKNALREVCTVMIRKRHAEVIDVTIIALSTVYNDHMYYLVLTQHLNHLQILESLTIRV